LFFLRGARKASSSESGRVDSLGGGASSASILVQSSDNPSKNQKLETGVFTARGKKSLAGIFSREKKKVHTLFSRHKDLLLIVLFYLFLLSPFYEYFSEIIMAGWLFYYILSMFSIISFAHLKCTGVFHLLLIPPLALFPFSGSFLLGSNTLTRSRFSFQHSSAIKIRVS
jgi:hypothetical protein